MLVTIEYRIDPDHAHEFADTMQAVRQQRLRDGAFRSGLFRDPSEPGRYLETIVIESWAEHLRQHQRVTVGDWDAEERAHAFHISEEPPGDVAFHRRTHRRNARCRRDGRVDSRTNSPCGGY